MSSEPDHHDRTDHIDEMVRAWAEVEPELDTSPLQVAGRLLRCAALLQRSIDRALAPLGLSFGDFDVINTLRRLGAHPGTHPKTLAASALITSGAMTARLDRLERAGLVRREPDPADRRAIVVRLTEDGTRLARRALDAVLAADREVLVPLDDDDQDRTAQLLRRLLVRAESP